MTWSERVPKVELHLHLEGAIPHATLWQLVQKYGGDPSVVGRTLRLNGHGYTVVGVAHDREGFLRLLTTTQADIALVDLVLSNADRNTRPSGIEVIEQVGDHLLAKIRYQADSLIHHAGLIRSRIAVDGDACAEVLGITEGNAAYARGHVDCLEIVRERARVSAVPEMRVSHPLAKVTHEAAIGSVDHRQLETLLSRGVSPEEAVDIIVRGMLR